MAPLASLPSAPPPAKAVSGRMDGTTKIRDEIRGEIAGDGQLVDCFRDQAPTPRGGERRDVLCSEAKKAGRRKVELVRAFGGEDRADLARMALRRAVAFHCVDGVAEDETRLEIFAEVDQHVRKIFGFRVFAVVFRLHRAGDNAEEVFAGVRHREHAVRFQLAEVNDRVRVVEPAGVGERPGLHGLRGVRLGLRGVEIERGPGLFALPQAADVVDAVQVRSGEESAGAVAQHDGCATLL